MNNIVRIVSGIQMNDILNQRIQVQGFQKGWRCFCKISEIIHHLFHGRYLIDDRIRTFLQDSRVSLTQFVMQFHLQAFGRKLDRRQWILDFMSQSSRNLTPCDRTLPGNHLGYVVENDDITIFIIDGMV